jgi:hypothetical protein
MLFRVVRPMKRNGSRIPIFVQRIPADVMSRAVGMKLAIPLGDSFAFVTVRARAQSVRFSLRTTDPSQVKSRQAIAAAYLQNVWTTLRDDVPVKLSHRQATALAGELYRIWTDGENRAQSIAIEQKPGGGWQPVCLTQADEEANWASIVAMWERVRASDDPADLEKPLGPLVDRLLLSRGIRSVEDDSRPILLSAFWMALRDAFDSRKRNIEGDYSPDPKANRFPHWEAPKRNGRAPIPTGVSLIGLVDDWWKEAKAAGRKPSTYESYRNTMGKLVAVLEHDDSSRVAPEDVVRFKDFRLATGASAKTVKDSDLAGLKTIFGWAVMNRKMAINPAEGLTIKASKPRKLRAKGFSEKEAALILKHAKNYRAGGEAPKLAAAKRWVPWLCAFTGARVGEMLQLRKQDIRREGKYWVVRITPEAGPVKTDEARDVVLHRQIVEAGFMDFVKPHPPFAPFTVIVLPLSENPQDYEEWAQSSPMRPTIVARSGGDLSELSLDALQAQFLKVCDCIPDEIDKEAVDAARVAIKAWKPLPSLRLSYQVGGHNTIVPNLTSLMVAGYEEMVWGRFEKVGATLEPYVEQIVQTSNSIFDERAKLGERDLQRIFRRPPDLNLFAPAIYPDFFSIPLPLDMDKALRRDALIVRKMIECQTGYGFDLKTKAQKSAMIGKIIQTDDNQIAAQSNPLVSLRASELNLNTALVSALTASEFSVCTRLPNEINRTIGSVRNFAQQYRSEDTRPRKRLLAFRQVQTRLAGAVPAEFIDLIRRSESGIRIISDAHLEWLNVDGLPLFIRKNCSRIPVTPGNLFVDHLAAKRQVHLTPKDFSSVLVLSALKREDPIAGLFEKAFEIFEPLWRKNLTVTCKNVASAAEFVDALNGFEGPMVIFDGHGSHSADEAAKLHLGDEAVDVWGLRGRIHNIPPIVVLSACDTHAAARNHATTANGFMSLGARAVLASVFPLNAHNAASFAARLVYRVSEFVPGAIEAFDQAITWTEVVSGLVRMQLLTDYLRLLEDKKSIDRDTYMRIHVEGNHAINGRADDPFGVVLDALEKTGLAKSALKLDLETAVANSSALSYLLIGRPETIIIDDLNRVVGQLNELEQ